MSPPRYCSRCVLPDTRPGVDLDADGVCRGCLNAEEKAAIDWDARARDFTVLAENVRRRATGHDCVIPVSGGKDSYWQVVTCLEQGLTPLCVTYAYPGRTALGTQNLDNLVAIGVDHVQLRLNPEVERRFIGKAFERFGISGLLSHMAIYAYPVQVAAAFDIPLVVYGENSAFEYGSDDESLMGARVDAKWRARFGVTEGTTADDWVSDDIPAKAVASLRFPSDDVLAEKDIRVVFLGHYFSWDPQRSVEIARRHGFASRAEGARVGHYDFVNIDDDMIGVHHHPKWHKFGITRTWDTLSMEIRAGRMTRDEAIERIAAKGDETPWDDIRVFCDYLGISQDVYFATVERFRNEKIWRRIDGRWRIPGFLVEDFAWPADPV